MTTINETLDKQLNYIQKRLGIKLSKEQLAVIKYRYQTPVLLNSCAGAGKTTVLLISLLTEVLAGTQPEDILAITFSKNAQIHMAQKFDDDLKALGANMHQRPVFRTFDALFLHLVNLIDKDVRILDKGGVDYWPIQNAMQNAIENDSVFFDHKELVNQILNLREVFINRGFTYDGYHLLNRETTVENVIKLATKCGFYLDMDTAENYLSVSKVYRDTKANAQLYDFTDVKLRLLKALGNSSDALVLKQAMAHFKLCVIDEFQDVDNLQWKLIRRLLPKQAMQRLGVIGDDDQAIYDFRGSDPSIIINFANKVANTKMFTLTTNYRTAGKILTNVAPMIENNQFRLGKPLASSPDKQASGEMVEFVGNQHGQGQALLLKDLTAKLANPDIDNAKVAVLCRNNLDIALASDYLYDQGYLLNVSKKMGIFQKQPLYKAFGGMMYAFYYDNFQFFMKYASMFGFSKYRKHVEAVFKHYTGSDMSTLSQYLKLVPRYNMDHLDSYNWQDNAILKTDEMVQAMFIKIQQLSDGNVAKLGTYIFNMVGHASKNYYDWMIKNGHVTASHYQNILQRLRRKIMSAKSLDAFFVDEQKRVAVLEDVLNQSKVDAGPFLTVTHYPVAMTLHSAKGLEYDYVYLFNFRANRLNASQLDLNAIFPPHLSRQVFLDKLLHLKFSDIPLLAEDDNFIEFHENLMQQYRSLRAKQPKMWKQLHHNLLQDFHPANNQKTIELLKQFNTEYEYIKGLSTAVEAERRLAYVGFTRAIKGVYYNADNLSNLIETTPLFSEVSVDASDKRALNEKHKLVPLAKTYKKHYFDQGDVDNLLMNLNRY